MTSNLNSPVSAIAIVYGLKSGKPEDLRKLARDQKVIWVCALAYLVVTVGYWASPVKSVDAALGILMPVLGIPGGIFTIMFATKLRNMFWVVLMVIMGLCAFCPVVGFFPLMIASAVAAYILKKNGIRVGILGADMKRLDS
jgi:hypothetical protein